VRKGGAGLGLVISGDLVRGHGGRLTLLQSDANGTTFEITLPKADFALSPETV
jgi:signal transduction histidine kinase